MTTILIIVIAGVLLYMINTKGDKKVISSTSTTPKDLRNVPECLSRKYSISGITHHCRAEDIGIVYGYIYNEPNNHYDPNAVAIIHDNGKKLGYIRKIDLEDYRDFAGQSSQLPFVGFIEVFENDNGDMTLYGKIKTYQGQPDKVAETMHEDKDYLMHTFQIVDHEERIQALRFF